jgi:hypothetical protein
MLTSGARVRGFKPGRSGEKILSMPSFGREVKPFAPCRRFAACKKIPVIYVGVGITGKIDRPFLARFRPSLTEVSHVAWLGAPLEMTDGTKGCAHRSRSSVLRGGRPRNRDPYLSILCSASWRWASSAQNMHRVLIHNKLNRESESRWFYYTDKKWSVCLYQTNIGVYYNRMGYVNCILPAVFFCNVGIETSNCNVRGGSNVNLTKYRVKWHRQIITGNEHTIMLKLRRIGLTIFTIEYTHYTLWVCLCVCVCVCMCL